VPVFPDIIAANLNSIQKRIAQAADRAGRAASDVQIMAVTKTVGIAEIETLRDLGVQHFGENRVEAMGPKIETLGDSVTWHMIGYIQRRKARSVVDTFTHVDSVDRLELAEALQRRCDEAERTLHILLEVNVSGEDQKHGFAPAELAAALSAMRPFDRLKVEGLLTMAPYDAPEAVLRKVFRELRVLADAHGLATRSMGMSDDFEVAIEEGSTQVRIGTALFK
jgi:pyridoxal phosphate enzyme (YggS family)